MVVLSWAVQKLILKKISKLNSISRVEVGEHVLKISVFLNWGFFSFLFFLVGLRLNLSFSVCMLSCYADLFCGVFVEMNNWMCISQ